MKRILRCSSVGVAALAVVLLATTAFADPPSRVARLNYIKGDVSFRPATLEEWGPATLNHPLTTGDHLWTDANAWTEMRVGSTAIRMAPQTAFAFLNLDDRLVQMRLSEGALDVRVRHLTGDVEIDTPSAAITVRRPGVYRVEVAPDEGATRVTVREGEAEVYGEESPFSVYEGQTASLYGTDRVSHEIYRAEPADEWERWCRARDDREERSASLRYVSYEMTGYEDLDEYGTWSSIPDYGWAWRPRYVATGWAPYRHGHWRWVDPWGWTWIDDAPWGFAPFHYGRWAHHYDHWYWVPGAYIGRPIYSPALVAFIGGRNWGVSFGFGLHNALAWFPLGPREFWMPHYRASHTYIRNLNVSHVDVRHINITNYNVSRGTYVNRAVRGAVTAVPRDAFLGGRAVPRSAFAVDRNAAMRSEVIATGAPVAPRVESVLPRGGGRVPQPTAGALRRTVVARNEPAGAAVPFRARERALQASNGRPLDDAALSGLRGTARTSTLESPVRLAGARASRRGGVVDVAPGAGASDARVSSPADRGGALAVPRGGERARSGGTPADRPVAGAPATVAPGRELNDRPGWARPRGGGAEAATTPRAGGSGRDDAAPSGARSRGEAGGAWTGSSRGSQNDRPGPAAGGARSRGEAGGAAGAPSPATENSRPGAVSGGARSRGEAGGAVNAPSRGAGADRPPAAGSRGSSAGSKGGSGVGAAAPQARPSPSGKPPGQTSGARPRSFSSSSWGGDNDRPASSYRPAPQFRSSSPSVSEYRSAPRARASAPSDAYRAAPQSRATQQSRPSAPAAQYRSAPQYRPSAPSAQPQSRPTPRYRSSPPAAPQYRATPQNRSSAPSSPQYRATPQPRSSAPSAARYRATPQPRSSAPSAPRYRATPQPRSSAPSAARPSGSGRMPSFSGGGSRSSGGGSAARPSGGGSRSSGGGAVSRPSGSRGAAPSGGTRSSGGARQRNRG